MTHFRIATRQSPLAMWQAEYVAKQLEQHYSHCNIEYVKLTTMGDKILDKSLNKIGGKGLFIKELEQALLDDRADIAVHSMKDMPATVAPEFFIAAICERDDPRDAFVSNHFNSFLALPLHATVGTSSLRRQAQLLALRPDLNIVGLRGNMGTRLSKLDAGEFDAIILAVAGLKRLGLSHRIAYIFSTQEMLPAVGQGAVAIECRSDNSALIKQISALEHGPTRQQIIAERAMNEQLKGGCQVPIAAHAVLADQQLNLTGLVAHPSGKPLLFANRQGAIADADKLGKQVAASLLAQGAKSILDELLHHDKP